MTPRKRTRKLTPAELGRKKALERILKDPKKTSSERAEACSELLPLVYEKQKTIVDAHFKVNVGGRIVTERFRMRCDPDLDDAGVELATMTALTRRLARKST